MLAVLYQNAFLGSYEKGFTDPEAVCVFFGYEQTPVTHLNYKAAFPNLPTESSAKFTLWRASQSPARIWVHIFRAATLGGQEVCWSLIQQPQLLSRLGLT